LKRKSGKSWLSPLLIAVVLIIVVLLLFDIPYESYKKGGDLVHMYLGPITVVLAVPLYSNWHYLKKYLKSIIFGIGLGSLSALISVFCLSKLFGLDELLTRSLLGRSITTPIALAVGDMIDANQSILIISVVITGILSTVIGPMVFKILKINHPVARGIALGTGGHAIGTSRAMEYGSVEGSMGALSIGVAGVMTIIWILVFQFFGII